VTKITLWSEKLYFSWIYRYRSTIVCCSRDCKWFGSFKGLWKRLTVSHCKRC